MSDLQTDLPTYQARNLANLDLCFSLQWPWLRWQTSTAATFPDPLHGTRAAICIRFSRPLHSRPKWNCLTAPPSMFSAIHTQLGYGDSEDSTQRDSLLRELGRIVSRLTA